MPRPSRQAPRMVAGPGPSVDSFVYSSQQGRPEIDLSRGRVSFKGLCSILIRVFVVVFNRVSMTLGEGGSRAGRGCPSHDPGDDWRPARSSVLPLSPFEFRQDSEPTPAGADPRLKPRFLPAGPFRSPTTSSPRRQPRRPSVAGASRAWRAVRRPGASGRAGRVARRGQQPDARPI